jgi:hypothetical protein
MYPQSVNEFVAQVVQSLDESGFLTENDVDKESATKAFGEVVFKRWKRGDDLVMSEEDAIKGMQLSIFESSMKRLVSKKMVDSIEDENGEEIFFLTEKGKDYANKNL